MGAIGCFQSDTFTVVAGKQYLHINGTITRGSSGSTPLFDALKSGAGNNSAHTSAVNALIDNQLSPIVANIGLSQADKLVQIYVQLDQFINNNTDWTTSPAFYEAYISGFGTIYEFLQTISEVGGGRQRGWQAASIALSPPSAVQRGNRGLSDRWLDEQQRGAECDPASVAKLVVPVRRAHQHYAAVQRACQLLQ